MPQLIASRLDTRTLVRERNYGQLLDWHYYDRTATQGRQRLGGPLYNHVQSRARLRSRRDRDLGPSTQKLSKGFVETRGRKKTTVSSVKS